MNKINKIGIILIAVTIFMLPAIVSSEGELIDTVAIVGFDSFIDNGILTDGKTKMVIRIMSAPTNTLSGANDLIYVDKVIIDSSKPNLWDNKILNSIQLKESNQGRNLTKLTWVTGEQIYP